VLLLIALCMVCMGLFHWLFWPLEQGLTVLLQMRWLPWFGLAILVWLLSGQDRRST